MFRPLLYWIGVSTSVGVAFTSGDAHALDCPSTAAPATNNMRFMLGLGAIGGGKPGAQLSLNWEHALESWLAIGATTGLISGDGASGQASYAAFVGPLVQLHTAPEGIQWFVAASLGGGVSSYRETYCTEDLSWNEGSCEDLESSGAGWHGGLQVGGTGKTIGVVARGEFTAPSFPSVTLNLSLAW